MNGYLRLCVNLLLAVLIAFILADIAYFASGYLRQSAFLIAAAVFVAALVSAILAVEIFSISRESSHVKRHIRRTKLERLAQRLVLSRMEEDESFARAEHMMNDIATQSDDPIEQISSSVTAKENGLQETLASEESKSPGKIACSENAIQSSEKKPKSHRKTASQAPKSETQTAPDQPAESTSEQFTPEEPATDALSDAQSSEKAEYEICCRLRIENLTSSASADSVAAFVKKFGEMSDIQIIRQGSKKKRRVSAIVVIKGMSTEDAIAQMNGQTLAGRQVSVSEESDKTA